MYLPNNDFRSEITFPEFFTLIVVVNLIGFFLVKLRKYKID